jgi:cell wall-associated NlpC family hydrolase
VGTPFHNAAAIKGVGVDCVRFLIEVLASCGLLERFEPAEYPANWHLHEDRERYLERIGDFCDPVQEPLRVGDVLLYRLGRCVAHGALYIGQDQVVHAAGREVMVDRVDAPTLATRYAGAWRLRCLR